MVNYLMDELHGDVVVFEDFLKPLPVAGGKNSILMGDPNPGVLEPSNQFNQ
jgi:hypothetical protein